MRLGLATRVSDRPRRGRPGPGRELAARNPHAIQAAKRLLNQPAWSARSGSSSWTSRVMMAALIGSPNQVEAVAAYFDKRPPVFADPE